MQIRRLTLRAPSIVLMPALHNFYTRTLGLPEAKTARGGFAVQAGWTILEFVPTDEQPLLYHFALNIPENQIAEAKSWLEARLPLMTHADGRTIFSSASWNADYLYFEDPAGNIVEFIARHALPNASSAPFSAQSLLCASEIGIVTTDVPAAVNQITDALGIQVYDRGDGSSFTAVGDEHGLFIVVRQGRTWFPTADRYAVSSPTEAQVANVKGRDLHLPEAALSVAITTDTILV